MQDDSGSALTPADTRELRRLVGIMVPASAEYDVPGADDETIFADILRSLGRDFDAVRDALARLRGLAGRDFTALDTAQAETAVTALLDAKDSVTVALGRAVLQCYYRDDRVLLSLGMEARPPYPKGHELEPGDWSQIEAVRGRPRMWRDVDGTGA